MGERCSTASLLGVARLDGYGLEFHKQSRDGSGKCSITSPGDGVWLAVYGMSADDKKLLDAIEGVNNGYLDITVDVPGFSPCNTYVAEASHIDDQLLPYDWYRALVLAGCRYHGFPAEYRDRIAALPTRQDPDTRRSTDNFALLDRLTESP